MFSAFFLLAILLLVRPLATFLPVASMAAVLFIVAGGLIDVRAMRRVWRTSRSDALAMAVTFVATLTIRLEVAILVGVLVSLLIYLNWARHPQVVRVAPDPLTQRRFRATHPNTPLCPQLDILRIDGALFFGSVDHIHDEIDAARAERPAARHLLLIATGVNLIDNAGAELTGIECFQINPLIKDYNGPACAYVTGPLGGHTVNARGHRFIESDYWSGHMMLEFYRERPTFRVVNGAQPPERVAQELDTMIDDAAAARA